MPFCSCFLDFALFNFFEHIELSQTLETSSVPLPPWRWRKMRGVLQWHVQITIWYGLYVFLYICILILYIIEYTSSSRLYVYTNKSYTYFRTYFRQLSLCICVCMHVCMYMYIYMYIYIYTYIYIYIYTYIYIYIYTYIYLYIYIHIHIYTYIYIYIYAHRTGRLPGACVFSHARALLFHGPPRSLRRVVAENCCETSHEANFVSYAWRGATPSVRSIPARMEGGMPNHPSNSIILAFKFKHGDLGIPHFKKPQNPMISNSNANKLHGKYGNTNDW